jgi:thiamine biosynthesis lipoprotein
VFADARFRVMGSDAHVVVVGGRRSLAELAAVRLRDLDRRWSRFRPDSEVSGLNCAGGVRTTVSPETALLLTKAAMAWRLTGGLFDPTVLGAVVGAGYDRSFERLTDDGSPAFRAAWAASPGASGIAVDGLTAALPAGVGFDPGGIGKGLAADLVVGELLGEGARGACVNVGGDLRAAGEAPGGGSWTIAVDHPGHRKPIARVGLLAGAVATSTTLLRRWRAGGVERHHLIDPTTGAPSDTDIELATVVAGEAWMAEALAKAVLLRGRPYQFDALGGTTAEALVVATDGAIAATGGLSA